MPVSMVSALDNVDCDLPGVISPQVVFPSPTYSLLQAQLYEPTLFRQNARLGRQSCDPWAHSLMSLN